MIVVDTNVLGYLFLTSEHSPWAERVLLKDPEWAAPPLWRSELRNVLALYLRKSILALADANVIMAKATELLQWREFNVRSEDVLKLASTSGCSAYDCEFVAVAMDIQAPLITSDRRLQQLFPEVAVSPEAFCSQSYHR